MRVLVTRPLEDAAQTAQALAARGHQAVLAPLLITEFFDGPSVPLDDAQAILATSANGVRALARRTARRDRPVLAVGPQTAAQARELGFAQVQNADGDAAALAVATQRWAAPDKGALLHVVGTGNDGTLAATLSASGFTVRRETLYGVTPATGLPPDAVAALRAGQVDAALFFSPRSAAVFCDCAADFRWDGVIAACISAATAAALAPVTFAQVRIAAAPNQTALLDLLA